MRRNGTCRGCGAQVIFTTDTDGVTLVLDYFEAAGGAGRYAIWDDGVARPVSASFQGLANPVHACVVPSPMRYI